MNLSATNTRCIADTAPAWYLVHCKPRQDERAELNLLRQGYTCYRPQHSCERIVRGSRQIIAESLFPGYLFIQLASDANWAPLRSTRGVSRLVGFGGMPLRLDDRLIERLKQRTTASFKPALEAGDSVRITEGGFAELDAVFVTMDGEQRVILLLNMLNRQQQISMPLMSVVKN
ncbi:transcription/translation regulatory transformer protein RfaH [Pseudomonas sp. SA3-5]|uniref:Transcription antitermination protein RfaH n=1 Tax=Pseudomonas aestuarii TaxID=3018340 RepID=A0ABT4XK37_9PSED|nr:transcription/translation regulatory transformer protein RfaH [Pseudomonas aestuarii]MDA7088512.1 transcription/translation regulatory transformer protein RfaH [Pseudomonas aestuarii]